MANSNPQIEMPLVIERFPPDSPKLFEIKEMDVFTACKLNLMWHSRLPIIDWSNVTRNTHYICFGAFYKLNWFATAIYSSPVAQNRMAEKTLLELRRFAIAPDAPKFTATYMLAKTIKLIKNRFPDITGLISYQDTEAHKGTIYKAGNWQQAYVTKGHSWSNPARQRNPEQSLADKICWEYPLNGRGK